MKENLTAREWADLESPRAVSTVSSPEDSFPIVVHSHLRWSWVWQRPQQTHSRLAKRHPVLFLEEAVPAAGGESEGLRVEKTDSGVLVAQPVVREKPGESFADREARVLLVLREALAGNLGRKFAGAAHWLYTPLMEPQIDLFRQPRAILYDCMDELSNFAFASPELPAREKRLLRRADVVFTGGQELYLAKKDLHSNVHAFGCGVEFRHFHRASKGLAPAPDLAGIPRPRLGYIGVIDERLDYELIASVAKDHPQASLVMVGPVVKVDPASLPRAANIHYLGPRPYKSLPSYLAGMDVCLMPFALNDASRFINPTKTLEYLASGKPVVSSPIPEVVRRFSRVVYAAGGERFSRGVAEILQGRRRLPARKGLELARRHSWTTTVNRMELLLREAIARREAREEAATKTVQAVRLVSGGAEAFGGPAAQHAS